MIQWGLAIEGWFVRFADLLCILIAWLGCLFCNIYDVVVILLLGLVLDFVRLSFRLMTRLLVDIGVGLVVKLGFCVGFYCDFG